MASKKISYMKLMLFISLFCVALNNPLFASHEVGSARLKGSNITLNNAVFIQDNKYPSIAALSTVSSWGFYDASFKNKLILGIDRYSTLVESDFVATITVEITSTLPLALGGGTNVVTKTLSVSYEGKNDHKSTTPHASINEDVFTFTNGYAVIVKVTGISISIAGGAPSTTVPQNVYLQVETDAERFYPLAQNVTPCTGTNDFKIIYDQSSDEFEISWTRINGAEQYDLEWLWLDAEKNSFWTNNPQIDFRNNSTRIRTSQQSYRISNVFEKGYVFFRLRGVGKSGILANTFDKEVYSPWSWEDLIPGATPSLPLSPLNSTIYTTSPSILYPSTANSNLFYVPIDGLTAISGSVPPIHEFTKSWQYKASYAEEGKKKEVISYFDGTLRNRQSVTKNNSDNNVIVGETYYDYNGRAAVQALPVPLPEAKIKFYQYNVGSKSGFNISESTQLPYGKADFDLDASGNTCYVDASELDTDYGSSNYYSGSNLHKQFAQGYVPDAEKFPISQTEYTNDNTGRISKQGGVGKTHQLGSNHETKYFYGTPEQIELDRLFGSEVGYNKHYKKNMVIDANGQVSISYIDQEGRTIATALTGQAPNNLSALTNTAGTVPLYSVPTATNVIDADLLNKANLNDFDTGLDDNDRIGDELVFSKKILVPTAGTYTISYDLKGTSYTYSCLPSNTCYDCVYDLEIDIYDNCKHNPNGFTTITKTLGNIIPESFPSSSNVLNVACDQEVEFSTSQLNSGGNHLLVELEQGEYTITKTLKINKEALSFYLNEYLKSDCVKSVEDFKEGLEPDITGCSITCDECVAALGTLATYTSTGRGSAEDFYEEYRVCKEPCEYVSMCDASYITMLADVSPGGQYGDWEDNNGECDPSLHTLSVYNEQNQLPKIKNFNLSYKTPNWRNPFYRISNYCNYSNVALSFVQEYRDEDGSLSKVNITRMPDVGGFPVYSPPINSTVTVPASVNVGDNFLVLPQQLKNVSDFIAKWKNSWAKSLVFYHPEYPYYDWCLRNSTDTLQTAYQVSVSDGTVTTSNYIKSSDNYDSLLLVTDDVLNLTTPNLIKLCNPININTSLTHYDPYWSENGKYYDNNGVYPQTTVGPLKLQLNNTAGLSFPWNNIYKNAYTRFTDYQKSTISLPVFAALITTSCVIQYGQQIDPNQLGCLRDVLNTTSGTTFSILSLKQSSADQILVRLPSNLQNKYWDNFRMMYLSLKQEMQQEAAESYAMNGDYRGCNDGIGESGFDPSAMTVPFTHYCNFSSSFSYFSDYDEQWFIPFSMANEPQYCNVFTGNLYSGKIKRFPNAKNATDLGNSLSAGDPGASIYASTGLCPNAFYFQTLINALGTSSQLSNSTINLSAVPEFNQDLYKVLNGNSIPSTYIQANWTNTSTTALSISANMQIGTNPTCTFNLNLPTTYTTGTVSSPITNTSLFTFANTGTGSGSTYSFLRLYHLVPTTNSGGTYNFTIMADIAFTSGSSSTFTTVVLNGSTCIPLTGCSFTPPCKPNIAAVAMQKLLNAIAATGNMCSASPSSPIYLNHPSLQPFFVNSFGSLLGSGNWKWQTNGASNSFIIKDGSGSSPNPNTIEINLGTLPCLSSGNSFSFSDITGSASNTNGFNINIKTFSSGNITNSNTSGTVLLNTQPLKMGECDFDIDKCNTIPHHIKEEMEAFLLNSATGTILQSSNTNLTTNYNFGSNMRSQLADVY
ncbi:MAG: hypothetical protein JNM51_14235, partial [Bacteroidia bacterium]|nr:hypothetical protein [Bacteroidia bacterium]